MIGAGGWQTTASASATIPIPGWPTPQLLALTPGFLVLQPPLALPARRPGCPTGLWWRGGDPHQFAQPLQRILPIGGLTAKPIRMNDQHVIAREPTGTLRAQPQADRFRQCSAGMHRESQLDGRLGAVDMLSTRSARPFAAELKCGVVRRNRRNDRSLTAIPGQSSTQPDSMTASTDVNRSTAPPLRLRIWNRACMRSTSCMVP